MITHSPRTRHVFQSRTVCRTQFLWTRRPVRAPNHWMRFLGAANSPTEPLLPIPCPDAVVLASGSLWTVGSACIGTVFMSCRQLSNLVGSAGCKCTPGDMGEDGDPTQWHVVRPDAHITTVPMARAAPRAPLAIGLPAAAGQCAQREPAPQQAGVRGPAAWVWPGCWPGPLQAGAAGAVGSTCTRARVRVYVPVAVWRAAAQAECRAWLALLLGCTEAHARQHTRLHTGYMPAPAFRWVGVAGG
jgi:hypothetical protein